MVTRPRSTRGVVTFASTDVSGVLTAAVRVVVVRVVEREVVAFDALFAVRVRRVAFCAAVSVALPAVVVRVAALLLHGDCALAPRHRKRLH